MKHHSIIVRAEWDDEAGVWVASSTDVCGLAVEADNFEDLAAKVEAALEDLMELNGFDSDLREIPVRIMGESMFKVMTPVAA